MVPATIGTQVGGSIMRPASYCGNFALKPTFGALNRGERQGLSQSVFGVHAGDLRDAWQVFDREQESVDGAGHHRWMSGAARCVKHPRLR